MVQSRKDVLREEIFGSGPRAVNIASLSRETKIPQTSLYGYRKNPYTIPLIKLIVIVKALGFTEEQIISIMKCF